MLKKNSSQSGVALLISLGMLVLLSILGIAFATNMRLLERTTGDFIFEVQARYLAEGGAEYAVAWLKDNARENFVFNRVAVDSDVLPQPPELPAPADLSLSADTTISIDATVVDTARQININNANEALLATLPGIGAGRATDIVNQRDSMPNDEFLTKQSICLTSGITEDGIFNNIKDYITTNTYIDPNVQDSSGNAQQRSAININTVTNDDNNLLENILDVVSDVGDASAVEVATALMANRPINSWDEFNTLVDGTGIDSDAKDNIKNAFNPNRLKPSGNIPTEFCFHSGGTYELNITANITRGTQIIASKRITTIVELFDLWNMTTREQFRGEDVNYNGVADGGEDTNGDGTDIPEYARITWLDSCPINIDECYQDTYVDANAETVTGALKIGYWDDFSEDPTYSSAQWTANSWTFQDPIEGAEVYTDGYTISDGMLKTWSDVNKEPYTDAYGNSTDPDGNPYFPDAYPQIDLGSINTSNLLNKRWRWFSFNLKCRIIDEFDRPLGEKRSGIPWHNIPNYWEHILAPPQMRLQKWQNVGQILFWRASQGSEPDEGESSNSVYVTYPDTPNIPPILIEEDRDGDPSNGNEVKYYDYGELKIWKDSHDNANPLVHDSEAPYAAYCSGGHNAGSLILATNYNFPALGDLPFHRTLSDYQATKDIHLTARAYTGWGAGDVRIKTKVSYSGSDEASYDANPANPYNKRGPGLISLYGGGNLPSLDNIRIIPADGYYISYPIDFGTQPFEWGTIFWTQTTPDTADDAGEEVYVTLEASSSNIYDFTPSWVANEDDLYNRVVHGDLGWDDIGGYTGPGTGLPVGLNNGDRYLKFKALLETPQSSVPDFLNYYSETPVLEDVWVTYLPKTKVLYWRDGGD